LAEETVTKFFDGAAVGENRQFRADQPKKVFRQLLWHAVYWRILIICANRMDFLAQFVNMRQKTRGSALKNPQRTIADLELCAC
jgi:hypothetical protein